MRAIAVDDEKLALDSLCVKLSHIGRIGEVLPFQSPEEALAYFAVNGADAAFLDISMPRVNGLSLAEKLRELKPDVIVIFITGYSDYAMDAMRLHADGYLMKPVDETDIDRELDALEKLRVMPKSAKRIRVQCFGNFEIFADGKPLPLERSKSRELMAFLVDRRGSAVTMADIAGILWEDGQFNMSRNNQIHNFLTDLTKSLSAVGCPGVVIRKRNSIAVDTNLFDCDYYACLGGDPIGINAYNGEYMAQYSWAEFTNGELAEKFLYK